MQKLNELDTSQVEPMAQVTYPAAANPSLRADQPHKTFDQDEALANAPDSSAAVSVFLASSKKTKMNLTELTIDSLHELLVKRQASAVEIAKAHFEHIERRDKEVRAYLQLCPELAFRQASEIDRQLAAGEPLGPLGGIPVAVKDVILTEARATLAPRRFWRITSPLMMPRRGKAGGGRGSHPGQDELRRIRHGILNRELRFLPNS